MTESDTYYNYEPLPSTEQRYRYCAAPRHGATHVQATWIEKYASAELGIEPTESYSCDDCHDSMLQAFMDEMLPEASEDELAGVDDGRSV